MTYMDISLVPRPPRPAFVACSTKCGGRPGRIYHVMRAAADIMFSLLMSGFVLSPSLFSPWIQFVLSVQFVLWVRLLLDRSWLATVRDVSRGTHHMINPSRPSPAFRTASDKSWAWRPGNEATWTVGGRMEEWHIPRKTASKWVHYRLQTWTVEWLSTQHQAVLATFLGFRKPLYSCTEGMCHSSTCLPVRHCMWSVLPGLPPH